MKREKKMVVRFRSPIVVEPYRMIWFDVQLTDPGPIDRSIV
jgi:hypothetical protein